MESTGFGLFISCTSRMLHCAEKTAMSVTRFDCKLSDLSCFMRYSGFSARSSMKLFCKSKCSSVCTFAKYPTPTWVIKLSWRYKLRQLYNYTDNSHTDESHNLQFCSLSSIMLASSTVDERTDMFNMSEFVTIKSRRFVTVGCCPSIFLSYSESISSREAKFLLWTSNFSF